MLEVRKRKWKTSICAQNSPKSNMKLKLLTFKIQQKIKLQMATQICFLHGNIHWTKQYFHREHLTL